MTKYYTWGNVSWGSPALLFQGDALSPEMAERCYPLLCGNQEVLIGLQYGDDTVFYRYYPDRFSSVPRELISLIRENRTKTRVIYHPTTGYRRFEPQDNEQTCKSIYKTQAGACTACTGDQVHNCALATFPYLFYEQNDSLYGYGTMYVLPAQFPQRLGGFEKISPKLCTNNCGIQPESNVYRLDFDVIDETRAELSRRSKNAAKTRQETRQTCPDCSHQDHCNKGSFVHYCAGPFPDEKEVAQNILKNLPENLQNFTFNKEMRTLLINSGLLKRRVNRFFAKTTFRAGGGRWSNEGVIPNYELHRGSRQPLATVLSYPQALELLREKNGRIIPAPPPLSEEAKALFFEIIAHPNSSVRQRCYGSFRSPVEWLEYLPPGEFRLYYQYRGWRYNRIQPFKSLRDVYDEWGSYTYFQSTRPRRGRT